MESPAPGEVELPTAVTVVGYDAGHDLARAEGWDGDLLRSHRAKEHRADALARRWEAAP